MSLETIYDINAFTYIKHQFAGDFGLHHLWCVLHACELHSTYMLSVLILEHTYGIVKICIHFQGFAFLVCFNCVVFFLRCQNIQFAFTCRNVFNFKPTSGNIYTKSILTANFEVTTTFSIFSGVLSETSIEMFLFFFYVILN